MSRLRALLARLLDCARGEHADVVESSWGILRYRCCHCQRTQDLGAVFVGVSNRRVPR